MAVGLYHLFELLLLFFLRRGLLSRAEDVPTLAGEDLYVSERDLSEWCDAAIAFWGLSRNGVKNYSKGPCVTFLE